MVSFNYVVSSSWGTLSWTISQERDRNWVSSFSFYSWRAGILLLLQGPDQITSSLKIFSAPPSEFLGSTWQWKKLREMAEPSLCTGRCDGYLTCIHLLDHPSKPKGAFPFQSWGNWGIEKLSDRSWITQLISIRVKIQTQASKPISLITHNPSPFIHSFQYLLSSYCTPSTCWKYNTS